MDWLQSILQIILEGLGVVKKAIPPDEIRIDRNKEKKDIREQDINQERLTDDYNYCKKRPELDMWDHVRNVHPKLDMETLVRHHKMLVARVTEYRKDIVKRKGFRWRKYAKWIEDENL